MIYAQTINTCNLQEFIPPHTQWQTASNLNNSFFSVGTKTISLKKFFYVTHWWISRGCNFGVAGKLLDMTLDPMPLLPGIAALFFIKVSLLVDESPHASHGGPLFNPWQLHSSVTKVFTNLQCAAVPLP